MGGGFVNDVVRRLVGLALVGLGLVLELRQRLRILHYQADQARLRARYGIASSTPVLGYGPEQHASIAAASERFGSRARYATTSGSTAEPKRILYPPERVAQARQAFIDAFARAFLRAPWRRQSFYVFSSLREDDSLTSYMMAEEDERLPPYLVTLQAPYRVQSSPPLRALAARYGDTALRVWVLALSNPGYLYSTNPSTLSTFLDALPRDWSASTALIRAFVHEPEKFGELRDLVWRLVSRGARARLRRIASSEAPLPLAHIAPAVHTYVCWTGGYVAPFLTRLVGHLPESRYRLLPMYSMSTETPETEPCFRRDRVAFLPIAEGVLYEFVPEGAEDLAANLVSPEHLETGRSYSMVVSDAYGLRRYQTDDLFLCAGLVSGLPDLRFLRRRSLSYSFTGEKLTGEQVSLALERLRDERLVASDAFFTVMPSSGRAGGVEPPHYVLVRVLRPGESGAESDAAARCDSVLSEINAEYRTKRASGRLGPMRGATTDLDDFLRRVSGERRESWQGQFKFLPLYRQLWDGELSRVSSEVIRH